MLASIVVTGTGIIISNAIPLKAELTDFVQ